jgi:hypothetical protein
VTSIVNQLYLAVLPIIHLGTGQTEQVITLTSERTSATEFFQNEVDFYVNFFQARIPFLIGGHVTGYTITKENTAQGLIIVRVTQNAG